MINELIYILAYIGLDSFRINFHIHWLVNDIFIMENEESFTHLMV